VNETGLLTSGAATPAFLAGLRSLPRGIGEPGRSVDLAGVAILTPAVLALVLPLVLGQSEHWPAWGWACLAGSG
jgi:hypothetical protein